MKLSKMPTKTNPPSIYIRSVMVDTVECHIVTNPNKEMAQMYIRSDIVIEAIRNLYHSLGYTTMSYNADAILQKSIDEAK